MLRLTSLATTALLRLPTSSTYGTILPRASVTHVGMLTADRVSVRQLTAGILLPVTGWTFDPRFVTRAGDASGAAGGESGVGTSERPRRMNHSHDERFAPYQLNQSRALVSQPPAEGGTH